MPDVNTSLRPRHCWSTWYNPIFDSPFASSLCVVCAQFSTRGVSSVQSLDMPRGLRHLRRTSLHARAARRSATAQCLHMHWWLHCGQEYPLLHSGHHNMEECLERIGHKCAHARVFSQAHPSHPVVKAGLDQTASRTQRHRHLLLQWK